VAIKTSGCCRWGYGIAVALFFGVAVQAQQQMADPEFQVRVDKPAYQGNGPLIVIDEAHNNFHTADGRYKPFADLAKSDGYRVTPGTKPFDKASLSGVDILVIANARGRRTEAAFTEPECDAVRDWVNAGGSLLLIADHAPFGAAAESLGKRFKVEMGKGWVIDRGNKSGSVTSQLDFSRDNGLLGDHPLLRGREPSEEVKRIRAFTGQSLSVPEGASNLMKLGETAREAQGQRELNTAAQLLAKDAPAAEELDAHSKAVGGRAQGIAMPFGKGKVVILGEAAMLSAQIIKSGEGDQQRTVKVGMNVPGYDNRQFALNILHWLSGLLQ
jgi:hypothetical protein